MYVLSLSAASPLTGFGPLSLRSGAYDGETYCFTAAGSSAIFRYDNCLEALDPVQTAERYTAICYDPVNSCFWAVRERVSHLIYRLDRSFQETDSASIRVSDTCGAPVNINYNSDCRSLTLIYSNGTAEFRIGGACTAALERTACGVMLRSVLQTPSIRLAIQLRGSVQSLSVDRCGEVQEFFFPFEYALRDIIQTDGETFRVLAMKNTQYPYLLTMSLSSASETTENGGDSKDCSTMQLWVPDDVR